MCTRERRAFPALTNVTHDYAKQDVAIPARPYVPAIKLQDRQKKKKKKHGSLAGVMKRVQCGGNLELCFLRSGRFTVTTGRELTDTGVEGARR